MDDGMEIRTSTTGPDVRRRRWPLVVAGLVLCATVSLSQAVPFLVDRVGRLPALAPLESQLSGLIPSEWTAGSWHHELDLAPYELVHAPAPDPAEEWAWTTEDPLERETLRRLTEGDETARALELPAFEEIAGRNPEGAPRVRARAYYVADSETGEVLLARNALKPLPVASISKLMGAMVYADSGAPEEEVLTLSEEDRDFQQTTRSRLRVGRQYLARDLLYHSLLPSDNRATHALLRHTLLSVERFGEAMNRRARALGLVTARFEEPTGLSPENVASARETVIMLEAALRNPRLDPVLRTSEYYYYQADRPVLMRAWSSNRLSHDEGWEVICSKTGFTYAAGSCLVMKTRLDSGRLVTLSILGAPGEKGRYPAARELRDWLEAQEL